MSLGEGKGIFHFDFIFTINVYLLDLHDMAFSIFCVKVMARVEANEIFCAIIWLSSQTVGYQGVDVESSKKEKREVWRWGWGMRGVEVSICAILK